MDEIGSMEEELTVTNELEGIVPSPVVSNNVKTSSASFLSTDIIILLSFPFLFQQKQYQREVAE